MTTETPAKHRGLLLALATFILIAATCGFWDLWGPDEGRYAQVGQELLGRSNWWLLTIFGEPYDQKPPLPFWIFAVLTKVLAGGEIWSWALRLPAAFFAAMSVYCTYEIGRRRINERAGWLAAVMLATSAQFASDASSVELNMMFAGWLTLAAFAWLGRPEDDRLSAGRAVLLWGAVAGAFFTKGPLAYLIILTILIAEARTARSWRLLARSGLPVGLPVNLALVGLWFYMQKQAAGAAFVERQIEGETITRFLHGDHQERFYYYFPRLFYSIFAPWSPLLIPAGALWWKNRRSPDRRMAPIVAWTVVPFVFFCIASGKRESYLLPLIPGMALISAWWLDGSEWLGRDFPRTRRVFARIAALAGAGCIVAAAVFGLRRELAWDIRFFLTYREIITMCVWGIVLLAVLPRLRRIGTEGSSLVHGIAGLFACVVFFNYTVVKPALNPTHSAKNFATEVTALLNAAGIDHVITALGKAKKTEYHTYGDYKVLSLDEDELGDGSKLTEMMVARQQDWNQREDVLTSAGFRVIRPTTASGDPVVIARRNPPPRGRETSDTPPMTFGFAGDTGEQTNRMMRLASTIASSDEKTPFKTFFVLGDNIYGDDAFDAAIDPRFKQIFKELLARKVPFHAMMGNHEDGQDLRARSLTYPLFNMDGLAYYERSYGGLITFFILDSEPFMWNPDQYLWFENALAQCETPWRILLLHKPLDASNKAHGPKLAHFRLLDTLIAGKKGVQAVIAGHNHYYERRAPRDGVVHITVGGSSDISEGPFPEDPGRVVGYNEDGSFLRLVVDEKVLRGEAINTRGEVVDTFEFKVDESRAAEP